MNKEKAVKAQTLLIQIARAKRDIEDVREQNKRLEGKEDNYQLLMDTISVYWRLIFSSCLPAFVQHQMQLSKKVLETRLADLENELEEL